MSAEDVIARHGQRYDEDLAAWLSCTCGWRIDTEHIDYSGNPDMQADRQYAAHLLDALRSNGFEVVELPGRDEIDADGQLYFADGDVRVDLSGSRSGAPSVWLGRDETSPEFLRAEAAEYLAAARNAEEGTP